MAELAVTATLGLVQIVSPLLISKFNHQEDDHDGIKSMESWLKSMKAFMEDHSGVEGSKRLEDQVEKVRDIAYDIEDVFEEFLLHSPPYLFHNHDISRMIHRFAHNVHHGFPLHEISKKIARIKKRIDDIVAQSAAFSNGYFNPRPSSSSSRTRIRHQVSPLLLDDEMVGYEKQKKEFIHQLVDGEKKLVTLAVAGPGGSGKTALVKNVFWKRGIMGKFDCHAWVHVSQHTNTQNFDAEELFVNMLRQFCGSRREPYPFDDGSSTLAKLFKYLAGKKYFVVLDDIWREKEWVAIKDAFPNAFFGSRIIVTTRSSDVASLCASLSHHIYNLIGLEWLEGWTLFCRKAFPDENENGECPSELKDCSVKIVKRCEGLPLAIVAVGGALAQKPRNPNEWERFHNNLGSEIRSDCNLSVISNCLLPGYFDLSSNLKSCFLYLSIFPEDYSVERGRLIRLWVAERFVMGTESKTAEEVAEDYLNELIHRNLVHVSNWDFDGQPRNFRVLNLVLNFIVQKCKDENFASIFPSENTSGTQKVRRLCVHNDFTHLPRNSHDFRGVRSMFLLRLHEISPPDFVESLRDLELVRVLDFQGAPLTEFPKGIERLILIRYLNLRGTKIEVIPSSIKKLSYLETLDLKQTDVTKLPKELSHLQNLTHLFAYKYNVDNFVVFDSVQGVKIYEGIGNLTNLQDLSLVKVGRKGRILKDLEKLTKLRKLGLMGLKREHGKKLCASVDQMQKIRTLDICALTKEEYLDVGEMRNPPRTLQRLYLKGRLNKFPPWISSLNNLRRLGLKWSRMDYSPLQALQDLPNLTELQLVDCYIGGELTFEDSSFKKLKILQIEEFSELHTIAIQVGAIPELKQISLRKCPKLVICPLGIDSLSKVEELTLYDMAVEFIDGIRKNGEDRAMVRHIPVIHAFRLVNRSWSFENLSDSLSH